MRLAARPRSSVRERENNVDIMGAHSSHSHTRGIFLTSISVGVGGNRKGMRGITRTTLGAKLLIKNIHKQQCVHLGQSGGSGGSDDFYRYQSTARRKTGKLCFGGAIYICSRQKNGCLLHQIENLTENYYFLAELNAWYFHNQEILDAV